MYHNIFNPQKNITIIFNFFYLKYYFNFAPMKTQTVSYSSYEIDSDGHVIQVATFSEAEKKFKNAKGREMAICYFYRLDYNDDGKLIEKYLIG